MLVYHVLIKSEAVSGYPGVHALKRQIFTHEYEKNEKTDDEKQFWPLLHFDAVISNKNDRHGNGGEHQKNSDAHFQKRVIREAR
jgi:hypothetical protein